MRIRDYLAALELVNEERVRAGLAELDHLPAGIPRDPLRCVIANAIPGAIVYGTVQTRRGSRSLPREVARFIAAFDRSERAGRGRPVDPGTLVEGGIEDDKGCLVPA